MTISLEKETRRMAKTKLVKLRNVNTGVTAYLPNGIDKVKMVDWNDAYNFIINFEYRGDSK